MDRQLFKDAFAWGFILWLIGYGLGMMLFAFVPVNLLGWIITPISLVTTLWVAFKKVRGSDFRHYFLVALGWTAIAIVFDYFFLVQAFKPADGYYKFDVYLYYTLAFFIPLLVGWFKTSKTSAAR